MGYLNVKWTETMSALDAETKRMKNEYFANQRKEFDELREDNRRMRKRLSISQIGLSNPV